MKVIIGELIDQLPYLSVTTKNKDDHDVHILSGKRVAKITAKNKFYKHFLNPRGIQEMSILSKKLLPDEVLINYLTNRIFVIEVKSQIVAGSVDEKLQTCDFKLKRYQKLLEGTGFEVKYYYVLNDWFDIPKYDDVKAYIREMNCDYFINTIPLDRVDLDSETVSKP